MSESALGKPPSSPQDRVMVEMTRPPVPPPAPGADDAMRDMAGRAMGEDVMSAPLSPNPSGTSNPAKKMNATRAAKELVLRTKPLKRVV